MKSNESLNWLEHVRRNWVLRSLFVRANLCFVMCVVGDCSDWYGRFLVYVLIGVLRGL